MQPSWLLALTVAAAVGQIAGVAILAFKEKWRAAAALVATLVMTAIFFFVMHGKACPWPDTVYTEKGTADVSDFLELLSRGTNIVTMDASLAEELRRQHVVIKIPALKDACLKDVLEDVVLKQLPGHGWTYEVVGKTIWIKRR
jgi:hypothetical protein